MNKETFEKIKAICSLQKRIEICQNEIDFIKRITKKGHFYIISDDDDDEFSIPIRIPVNINNTIYNKTFINSLLEIKQKELEEYELRITTILK